jgi:hypothetical protein
MDHSLMFDLSIHEEVKAFSALMRRFNEDGIPYKVTKSLFVVTLSWSNGF